MTIFLKSPDNIEKIRISGKLAAQVLKMIKPYIVPGISTGEINHICHQYIINKQKATPAALGYRGFPKSICTSVNDVVCHGIPNDTEKLKEGDIINVDVTILKNGFYADTSKMFFVGNQTDLSIKLCKIAKESMYTAIKIVKPGIRLNAIGKSIQNFVKEKKFSIVREYCGHGIGKNFHESPQVLHYDSDDHGIILQSGMVFTIEPMINVGSCHVQLMNDGWTVKTKDRSLSAQYEHTILVTKNSYEVITRLRPDDSI